MGKKQKRELKQLREKVAKLESRSTSNQNVTLMRQAFGGKVVGYWSSDHFREAQQYKGWKYIAVSTILDQIRKATVNPKDLNDKEHPLYEMVFKPNPEQSLAQFNELRALQLRMTGVCVVYHVENRHGGLQERYVIPTGAIAPTRQGFRVTMTALQGVTWSEYPTKLFSILAEIIPYEECQVIRLPHPLNFGDGMSPTSAIADWIDLSEQIDDSRFNVMAKGPRPGMKITETEQSELDDEDRTRIKAELRQVSSGPENAGDHLFVPRGLIAEPWSLTSAELDHVNGFTQVRDAILAADRVPPVAAGIMEASSHAEFYAAMLQMSELVINPMLNRFSEADRTVFGEYTDELPEEFEYAAHRIDEPDLIEAKAKTMKELGVFEEDEIRAVMKFPPRKDKSVPTVGGPAPANSDSKNTPMDETGTGIKEPAKQAAHKVPATSRNGVH